GGYKIYSFTASATAAQSAGNDSLVDSPTNGSQSDTGVGGEVRGNYCTWNPLASAASFSNGNLEVNSSAYVGLGSIGVLSGKWYFETTIDTRTLPQQLIGVATTGIGLTSSLGIDSKGWGMIVQDNASNGQAYHSGSVSSTYTTYVQGDIVNVAFDVDAGKLWFGKNGTWLNSGVPSSGTGAIYSDLSGPIFPAVWNNNGGKFTANFGQRAFGTQAPQPYPTHKAASLVRCGLMRVRGSA
ncbi:MAG: hypothetical protein EBZ69_10460, partial [Alphaproteobacteria bacterium]|nr:hypothetical protein [Alphaproteobacteria bacterium]